MIKDLLSNFKNVYETADKATVDKINGYATGYIKFLNDAKTEREAVCEGVRLAEEHGFKSYTMGMKLEQGGKYYYVNRKKSVIFFVIGKENPECGIRLVAAHIDSPRIDLKPRPVFEDCGLGFFKTHYYGGIKKYQWTTIPLSMHGTIAMKDGKTIDVSVGEKSDEPVFYINDLPPHIAQEQMKKPLATGIEGENLNILAASVPTSEAEEGDKDKIKLNLLSILNEKYGITEADFLSSEICFVPAFEAREVGFDRALIGGYGHDDRVCAYPALSAILEAESPDKTLMTVWADKEEIGSEGNTGMQSAIFMDIISEIAKAFNANNNIVRANTKCISSDVNVAFDPNFKEAFESRNSAYLNYGVCVTKYTGSRGKSSSSDASAEYVGFIRNVLDRNGVIWQTGELGKVDLGGGGTVAMYIANNNIDVIDIGVPVISMHAPYEIIAKADIYMAYRAFSAFFN